MEQAPLQERVESFSVFMDRFADPPGLVFFSPKKLKFVDTKEGKWAKQESRKREREQAQAVEVGRAKAARVSQEVAEFRAALSRAGRLTVRE